MYERPSTGKKKYLIKFENDSTNSLTLPFASIIIRVRLLSHDSRRNAQ